MERILIIGCSGSGKSTLAVALGEKLGLPVVHLDQLWWKEGWRNVTREEFDSRLAMAMNMDGWIIDGNYSRTMEMRLAKCDTVIYLDFNRWACLRGMCQRVFGNYGKARPDMAQGCPERFDPSFVKWIWDYNKNNRVRNYMYLAQAKHAKTIVLKIGRKSRHFFGIWGTRCPTESNTTKIDSPNRQVGTVEILNSYTMPCAVMASATFRKPAMLAPAT